MSQYESLHMDELVCPYCKSHIGDAWELPESGVTDCPKCERNVRYERQVSVSYLAMPDCELNGAEHDTDGRDLNGMACCSVCGDISPEEFCRFINDQHNTRHEPKADTVKCKCGAPGVDGNCPFTAEINNEDHNCTCCAECRHQCAMDI